MLDRFAVRLSPTAPYPQAQALVKTAAAGDWAGVRRVVDEAEPQARTRLIRLVAEHDRLGDLATRALDADPADATAAATRAVQLVHQGWRIRGDTLARYVSARRFEAFHRYLAEAERVLHAGLTRSPHDPALWTVGLVVARGLQLGLDQARYRYECLAAFDPHHLPGQSHLLQQLCPKWGGTWSAAEEFARSAARAAPDGAHSVVLIADYYLEKMLDQRNAVPWRRADVRAELAEAADRSVRHPAFRRTIGWVQVVNSFAAAFSLFGDRTGARQMFAMLGPYASEFPWVYQSDYAPAAFRRSRLRANGLSGGLPGVLPGVVDALLVAASPGIQVVRRFVTR
ncbi:hypothetical protein Acy02nite_73980 [Actinoplanes cyaneus]|uniref:DUF4034 domain-containing protein n=1 Tax=Actinoplanes cyaneus TaxID=52696 RepID=A0A919M869_9ACTN|nr:hypothetical protein [Actinoplanes cyaneus]MCW2135484.1 hypothetical protein [Actinoplanes cyaneus]GID69517.1 hypothetical protein Acy02nite_73980 [Actinoplanes cyaneus]